MSYETKPNTGSLFSNKDKPGRSENGPDYSGSALIEGVEMFMDAWIKTSQDGKKWMSFSFKPKQKQRAPLPREATMSPTGQDDDIPF